jgi:hypothetical protein
MRPGVWNPPVEPSPAEQTVIRLVRRAKLFVFLRRHRHERTAASFHDDIDNPPLTTVDPDPGLDPGVHGVHG